MRESETQPIKVSRIKKELRRIYSKIPEFKCLDNCGKCCGPIYWSLAEEIVIRDFLKKNGIEYRKARSFLDYCPYLNENKRCDIYPVRPLICRVYGVLEDLKCPFVRAEKTLNREEYEELKNRIARISEKLAVNLGVVSPPVRAGLRMPV